MNFDKKSCPSWSPRIWESSKYSCFSSQKTRWDHQKFDWNNLWEGSTLRNHWDKEKPAKEYTVYWTKTRRVWCLGSQVNKMFNWGGSEQLYIILIFWLTVRFIIQSLTLLKVKGGTLNYIWTIDTNQSCSRHPGMCNHKVIFKVWWKLRGDNCIQKCGSFEGLKNKSFGKVLVLKVWLSRFKKEWE